MPHRGQRILVVEDDQNVRTIMQLVLQRSQLAVTAASSGEEALTLAQAADFDLITLDIDLPGINGYEVCEQLKQHPRSKHTPVIFVSARLSPDDQQHAREAGGVDFITKPFDVGTFMGKVKEHLLHRQDRNETKNR